MIKLWTIATNAFTETTRQPIFTILLLVTFGVLLFDVPLAGYSMDSSGDHTRGDQRVLVDLGLSTLMMSALFFAAFSASAVLAREIDRKTVLTVVSKPVSRPVVLLGKFFGVAAAVTVAFYLASLVFLMTVRHGVLSEASDTHDLVVIAFGVGAFVLAGVVGMFCNYFFGWPFTSVNVAAATVLLSLAGGLIAVINKDWTIIETMADFGSGVSPAILPVLVLLWMAAMVMSALAVAVSTRLGQAATLGACVGMFLLFLLTEALFKPHMGENALAGWAYRLLPNLSYFFALDALTLNQDITAGYVALAAGYGVCHVGVALLLGIVLFQTREIDARPASASAPPMVNAYAWLMRATSIAAGLVGLVVLAGPGPAGSVGIVVALLAGAVAGWLVAGRLGRGARWSLYLIVLLTPVQIVHCVVYLVFLFPQALDPLHSIAALALSAGHVLYVAIMACRRATRAHFAKQSASVTA